MRLLHSKDKIFEDFIGLHIPPYAIVSHCWSSDEVSYVDYLEGAQAFREDRYNGYGWTKIAQACEIARKREHEWVWIDTCCIDKRSSAELSEAINSMFMWYRNALECYIFLPDVCATFSPVDFQRSRWFTRAWTLQELIAPKSAILFSKEFIEIGTRLDLVELISKASGIPHEFLYGDFRTIPVGTGMKWASKRQATRVEDIAYSLLGIFGVEMPLLYGEGRKAFHRLQTEIIRLSDDESIYTWNSLSYTRGSLLAPSPAYFAESHSHSIVPLLQREHIEVTHKGIRMTLYLPLHRLRILSGQQQLLVLVPLNLCFRSSRSDPPVDAVPCLKVLLWKPSMSLAYGCNNAWLDGWRVKYLLGQRQDLTWIGYDEYCDIARSEEKADVLQDFLRYRQCDVMAGDDSPQHQAMPVYFLLDQDDLFELAESPRPEVRTP